MSKYHSTVAGLLLCLGATGCNPEVTFFNSTFLNFVSGGLVPIAPGPDAGYVMAFVTNSTDQSIEWVVTAESEEILVNLDRNGGVLSFDPPRRLEPQTVNLLTDVNSPTLAIVFDNSPAEFPTVGPGEMTFNEVQNVVDQLAAKDPEAVGDREFIRLVRVLRIGLGPDLDVPSGQDEGLIVRPSGSNPDANAGSIFPSEVNNALSFDQRNFLADFGNGDMLIFLATTSANAVGGIRVIVGVLDGLEANGQTDDFERHTFKILRRVDGPISPPPPN